MISVFIDTFVILNLTVFAVLTTDAMSSGKDGTALTQAAFMQSFGNFGSIFIAICLLFFAFSTILGWHFFGLTNAKYLFGEGAAKVYSFIVVICIVIGSMLKVNLVWALADFFNALMVIPNVLALLALSHVVVAADRKAETAVFDGSAHPLARLAHGGIRQADELKARQAAGDAALDHDGISADAGQAHGIHA